MEPDENPKLTEADLAACVVRYFSDNHWQVYQEVQLYQGSSRADIVVTQGKLVGVVECKQALGLPVLEQIWEWRQYAHLLWVATWNPARGPRSRFLQKLVEDYGIGVLQQSKDSMVTAMRMDRDPFETLHERTKPSLLRGAPQVDLLRAALRPEHQTTVAGTNKGGHWTPFKQTCSELERIVREKPGITLREALGEFKHHYSNTRSAMCNLPEWIEKGKVPGVHLDRSDGKLRLWITSDQVENKPP